SPRKRRLPFWCGKCLELSLNSRRRVPSLNSQQLASASVSARGGAREGSRSARQDLRLLLLPVSFVAVGLRLDNYLCVRCQTNLPLRATSMSVANLTRRSRLRAWWSRQTSCWPIVARSGGKGTLDGTMRQGHQREGAVRASPRCGLCKVLTSDSAICLFCYQ